MPKRFTPLASQKERVILHCQIDAEDRIALEEYATAHGMSLQKAITRAIRRLTKTARIRSQEAREEKENR